MKELKRLQKEAQEVISEHIAKIARLTDSESIEVVLWVEFEYNDNSDKEDKMEPVVRSKVKVTL